MEAVRCLTYHSQFINCAAYFRFLRFRYENFDWTLLLRLLVSYLKKEQTQVDVNREPCCRVMHHTQCNTRNPPLRIYRSDPQSSLSKIPCETDVCRLPFWLEQPFLDMRRLSPSPIVVKGSRCFYSLLSFLALRYLYI